MPVSAWDRVPEPTRSIPGTGVADTHIIMIYHDLRINLTEFDTDGSLKPELAESWEASEGAARWTFKLRQGVEFHDGKTLDARDVVPREHDPDKAKRSEMIRRSSAASRPPTKPRRSRETA